VQKQKTTEPETYVFLSKNQTVIAVNVMLELVKHNHVKIDLNQQLKPGIHDYMIDHNFPDHLTSIKVNLGDILLPEQQVKFSYQTFDCLQWCKMVAEDPSLHMIKYLIQKSKKGDHMSEEDKIVTKIIGLMEKSVFKPKGLQDLKRQVK
jgi:hypothetical protein